jgi:hypothetical protein
MGSLPFVGEVVSQSVHCVGWTVPTNRFISSSTLFLAISRRGGFGRFSGSGLGIGHCLAGMGAGTWMGTGAGFGAGAGNRSV